MTLKKGWARKGNACSPMTNPTGKVSARRLPNEPVTRQKLAERTGLNRFNPAQGGVRGMRIMAGGLLVAMAGVFLFARTQVPFHPAWGFVRAFAEAAMVGGLADWFAVTADRKSTRLKSSH